MAPPRQRTAAIQDDSRSEASSTTTKELKSSAAKARKAAAGSGAGSASVSSREAKTAANVTNVTSAPAAQGEQADDLPRIPWSEMPLEFLHSYRHAYKLPSPSAFSTEYAQNLLSRGIGLRSPTAIAAQRAHLSKQDSQKTNGSSSSSSSSSHISSTGLKNPLHHRTNGHNGMNGNLHARPKGSGVPDGKATLNHIIGQDRVSKNQLATAVRKHFNSAGLVEQEAIARFLYKVREEGRGRHFRLKFQP